MTNEGRARGRTEESGQRRRGRGNGHGGKEGGREDKREKVKIKWWKRRRSGGLAEKGFVKLERKRGAEVARRGEENEVKEINGRRRSALVGGGGDNKVAMRGKEEDRVGALAPWASAGR